MIFDTSFLIELIRGNPDAFQKSEQIHDDGEIGVITPVVFYELFIGALSSEDPDQIRVVLNLVHMYMDVGMDLESAQQGARILTAANSRHGGSCGVGHRDAMIAGIADNLGHTVLTKDSDFDDLGVNPEIFN